MKHEDNVRESSRRENTHKEQAKERWEEHADESLRGRESKMQQEGVSADFHNVTLMKPFMITDGDSQKCSLAGSLHTHILISLNAFPALVEVGTFFASAACSKSGLSLCVTKPCGAISPRSALEELAHELRRAWQPCTGAGLQEKQSKEHAIHCQSKGDVTGVVSCGT